MGNYKIVFKKSVSKDLRPIPNKDIARILQRMNELQENPRPVGSEKLSGRSATGFDRVCTESYMKWQMSFLS